MDVVGKAIGLVKRVNHEAGVGFAWQRDVRRGVLSRKLIDFLVKPDDIVVDVGAADGIYAERMLQLVGPGGTVYAIEPNPAHSGSLQRIARKRRNFRLFPLAASDWSGETTLFVPRSEGTLQNGLGSLRREGAPDNAVEVLTSVQPLDALLSEESRRIAFVKIDVEGHERKVLAGATRVLNSSHPVLLVEIEQRHHDTPIDSVIDEVESYGYSTWALGDGRLIPRSDFDLERDQLRFLTGTFQNRMPRGYINDFLFLPPEKGTPSLTR